VHHYNRPRAVCLAFFGGKGLRKALEKAPWKAPGKRIGRAGGKRAGRAEKIFRGWFHFLCNMRRGERGIQAERDGISVYHPRELFPVRGVQRSVKRRSRHARKGDNLKKILTFVLAAACALWGSARGNGAPASAAA
jgi:hypothetical protein